MSNLCTPLKINSVLDIVTVVNYIRENSSNTVTLENPDEWIDEFFSTMQKTHLQRIKHKDLSPIEMQAIPVFGDDQLIYVKIEFWDKQANTPIIQDDFYNTLVSICTSDFTCENQKLFDTICESLASNDCTIEAKDNMDSINNE